MKKAIAIILLLSSLFLLFSCGGYDPVESSEEEARVVMTARVENETYEIKYELFRMIFLNRKGEIDKGDSSVWSGSERERYISAMTEIIKSEVSRIYGAIHLAKSLGFDVLSSDYDKAVEEIITASVDGGTVGSQTFEGFDGDYSQYLGYLKSKNMNYSTQDLLIRYAIALEEIYTYYTPSVTGGEGELTYTDDVLREFYYEEDTARVLALFLDANIFTEFAATAARNNIANNNGEEDAAIKMINYSTSGASDITSGMIVSRYNMDPTYYADFTEAAISLPLFEVSQPIYITTPDSTGYYIFYKALKSDTHFESSRTAVADAYINNEIGKRIDMASDAIFGGISLTDVLVGIDYSNISMN